MHVRTHLTTQSTRECVARASHPPCALPPPCMQQNGETALMLGILYDHDESVLRLLLERKADVNASDEVLRGEG